MHHRQLTAAAAEIGVTQSALSHALRRLSTLLGQELFIRSRSGMQPTRYAEAIAPDIEAVLDAAQSALGVKTPFVPNRNTTFRLALTSDVACLLSGRLASGLVQSGARLELFNLAADRGAHMLAERGTDMVLGSPLAEDSRLDRLLVLSTPWVAAARKDHPVLTRKKDMSLRKYLACRHILTGGGAGEAVAHTLAGAGLRRQTDVVAPDAMTALQLAASSELVATVPKALAQQVAKAHNLRLMPLPLDVPPCSVHATWLKARATDPLVSTLLQAFASGVDTLAQEDDED